MDVADSSFFDALVNGLYRRPHWRAAVAVAGIFVLPFAIALVDVPFSTIMQAGNWRVLVLQPAIVVYILAVAPIFSHSDGQIADSIRPIAELSDAEFGRVVAEARRGNPRGEWIAFGVGVGAGFFVTNRPDNPHLVQLYLVLAFLIMYGMMGWVFYKAFVSSRLSRALLRQPLNVNLFDIAPFEPIGRQSLLLSMAFVGGTTISLFFSFRWDSVLEWQFLAIYATLIGVSILVFFVNMWPTHQLLARTKQRHLANAAQNLAETYDKLAVPAAHDEEALTLYARINAWTAMESRLRETRTWPYDTEMLRTLFITILLPVVVALARILAAWI